MRQVPEHAVLAAAGDGMRVYRTALVTYVLGSDVLVILLEPGDRPDGTGVRDAQHIAVTSPFPDEIHELLYQDLVCGFRQPDRPSMLRVEGYVRLPSGCVPLGPLRMAGGGYDPRSERLRDRTFRLDAALPFVLLDRIRSTVGPQPGPEVPSVEWLRLLPHDPVGALSEFVAAWYADVRPVVGPHPAAATPMPPALAALHKAIAGRQELLGRRDYLLAPHELRLDEAGRLLFGAENQGCFLMATEPEGDDPPVWFLREDAEPERKPLPLSWFLLATMLFEATVVGHYTMWGHVWREDKVRVLTGLRRVPLPSREWLDWETETYVGRGLVVQVAAHDDTGETWHLSAGARRREDLRSVEQYRNQ